MSALTDAHSSVIALHSVPWNDYSNVPCFKTQSELDSYFNVNQVVQYTQMTYIRNDATYRVQMDINTFKENHINYMTFDNGSGREYAFVRNPRFVDLNCTEFDIETDVWVTYMFKHDVSGIVHRAHVDRWSDGIATPIYYKGDWTNIGEPVIGREDDYTANAVWAAIYCSNWPAGYEPEFASNPNTFPRYLGGSLNNLCVYLVPFIMQYSTSNPSEAQILTGLNLYVGGETHLSGFLPQSDIMQSENIYTIQLLPFTPFVQTFDEDSATLTVHSGLEGEFVPVTQAGETTVYYFAVSGNISGNVSNNFYKYLNDKPTSSPNHNTPASIEYESRLWSAPYYQLMINNYADSMIIDPADIEGNFVRTNLALALGAGDYGVTTRVTNWSNDSFSVKKEITDMTPMVISWSTDKFYNYMVQNQNQLKLKQAYTAVEGKISMMTSRQYMSGGQLSNIQLNALQNVDYALNVAKPMLELAATAVDSTVWPKSVSAASGNQGLACSGARTRITCQTVIANSFIRTTMGSQFIQKGYEINQFATNFDIRSRYWFNYIQYIDPVCTSAQWLIPEHKTILEQMYSSGFTAWHHTSTAFSQFGKYNLDNTEVSIDGA